MPLACNPILEAVANAKTLRNDNSSRFGKFIEVQFNAAGYISGAIISVYLLEKSRVVNLAKGERNFHVFYQLIAGMPDKWKKALQLGAATEYRYIAMGDAIKVPGINDKEEFATTKQALDTYGVDEEDQLAIFKVFAAILHMGNLEFKVTRDRPKQAHFFLC